MKKTILSLCMLAACVYTANAQKMITRTAKLSFNATAQGSPEDIVAVNNEVANILDATTGDMVFQVLIKSFKFERALMQEHFNENYMESDQYPKADFRGKITNLDAVDFKKDGTYKAQVAGKLTIHGVTQSVNVPGSIQVKNGAVTLSSKFSVKLEDYKISIPGVVADKIAKTAIVSIESSPEKK